MIFPKWDCARLLRGNTESLNPRETQGNSWILQLGIASCVSYICCWCSLALEILKRALIWEFTCLKMNEIDLVKSFCFKHYFMLLFPFPFIPESLPWLWTKALKWTIAISMTPKGISLTLFGFYYLKCMS